MLSMDDGDAHINGEEDDNKDAGDMTIACRQ